MLKEITDNPLMSGDVAEAQEWLESLDDVLHREGPERLRQLLVMLQEQAYRRGVKMPFTSNTPYINTIPTEEQPLYPGNREIERRIKNIIRWNAMAMVVRANRNGGNVGGHISTYASAATLLEVGFNHFFHAPTADRPGDQVYFQGHASPGVYSRAFLEGRLTEAHLKNFRHELAPGGGLSSYPHPWLMPDFWQFPTVSMGLGPIMSIYHARFLRYLEHRGLLDTSACKVWCFIGDGEVDEPETLGAINLASREKLDNLIFVINCNLQRLDGPVRGNGKIIQELEAGFRGSGWNVIKVVWGSDWDPLLAEDHGGLLMRRMGEIVDGQYQKYVVEPGSYIREDFFGAHPDLLAMVEHLSDEQLSKLKRGGHDPEKVYTAYKAAVDNKGSPSVILAKTIKGYGLGEAGEGRNVAHNSKKMNEAELRSFRNRFSIPINDDRVDEAPFYKPEDDSPEVKYLHERRKDLGGYVPQRKITAAPLDVPALDTFKKVLAGSGDKEASTTFVYAEILRLLMKDKAIGKNIVPIIPDEARTFGMEAMFSQFGIYASTGQLYKPVDSQYKGSYYKEAKDGQILEEGINEAGAVSSFICAGTAYANLGINMVPMYIYYSMFGFQRIGDFIWAAADSRCKGFLVGGTAGRTTLNGEGLQHQDGHSHLLAATVPNLLAYDPAFGYELAVIIQEGLRRMYANGESILYYITTYNEDWVQPAMPEGVTDGILKGMYKYASREVGNAKHRVQLLGSGPAMRSALKAAVLLEQFGVASDIWSVTSYKELRREALEIERWNLLHPEEPAKTCYIQQMLGHCDGPIVAVSDYMHLVNEQIAKWLPCRITTLGTDGFGRSESREALRKHFEVDAPHTAFAAISALVRTGKLDKSVAIKAREVLGIDSEQPDPVRA